MKNTKRHPDYFKFKTRIELSDTIERLNRHRQAVSRFVREHFGKDDATDINILFLQKEEELTPNYCEENILNIYHRQLSR